MTESQWIALVAFVILMVAAFGAAWYDHLETKRKAARRRNQARPWRTFK